MDDIICAPITGVYRAPVAVIRCSGDGSWRIAEQLFRASTDSAEWIARHAYYGSIVADDTSVIDDGLLVLFEDGASYTGEQSFELSCHGNPSIVRDILNRMISLGARKARPGEFTERAFMSGRMDLTQAESVLISIEAETDAQLQMAQRIRAGKLSEQVALIEERISRLIALTEATGDFVEEIGELDRESAHDEIMQIVQQVETLLAGYDASRVVREGLRVAIVGRPNVGKSSLLNALLGTERAIVTEIAGTTRDMIEERVQIAGYPVVLSDTAGVRDSTDKIEQIGIERSRAAAESADEVWLVFESHLGWTNEDEQAKRDVGREPDLLIANKSDLGGGPTVELKVSALAGTGLEAIKDHIRARFEKIGVDQALIIERHREEFEAARSSLIAAAGTLTTDFAPDLALLDLYAALAALGRITGRVTTDDLLERVFRDFCIGK